MCYGYNSHSSHLIKLRDIYDSEMEKGNDDVCAAIGSMSLDCRGTWVCYKPLQCFKRYVLSADCFDMPDEDVRQQNPDFMDYVYRVDLSNLTLIYGNEYTGYLYADLKSEAFFT